MTAKQNTKSLSFEQAIENLEQIIEQIESGEIGLEDSLSAYEQGMKMITHCRSILSKAETKIEELTVNDQSINTDSDDDDINE